jgi:hypothetical protein
MHLVSWRRDSRLSSQIGSVSVLHTSLLYITSKRRTVAASSAVSLPSASNTAIRRTTQHRQLCSSLIFIGNNQACEAPTVFYGIVFKS